MNHTALRKILLTGAIAALGAVGVVTLPAAAAAAVPESMSLAVSAEEIMIAGLVPGDSMTRAITVDGTGSVRYDIDLDWSGSAKLASQLMVTITDSEAAVMYRGTLSDLEGAAPANLAGRSLSELDPETITVAVQLPLSAGNEVQGAELQIQVVVEAVGATD